jgi:putative transposase
MARENPTWGRRRIQAELALLSYEVAELTVAKYMHRPSPRPSPTWRAFVAAHAREIVAVDFFLVPTLTFRLLFVFIVLRHDRRELIHFKRHGPPHGRLDRPADRRGIPKRHGPEVLAP